MGMGDGYVGTSQDAKRIRKLQQSREEAKKAFEDAKKASEQNLSKDGLKRFGHSKGEALETAFKKETVGLVTRDKFLQTRATLEAKLEEEEREKKAAAVRAEEQRRALKRRKRREAHKAAARLSFMDEVEDDDDDEDDDEEEEHGDEEGADAAADAANGEGGEQAAAAKKMKKMKKNPSVATHFLPDRDRDLEELRLREQLKDEWKRKQEEEKARLLEVVYSYWDGTGHRRKVQVKQGNSIYEFLDAVRKQLAGEFREIKTASTEHLMYIKEDLIIPHHLTFHELITTKARGKSGPLYHFDVHEDVRLRGDATKEKDESHAGKVVERHWYEKNKHIFPASRWEIFDPAKKIEKYSIYG